MRKANNNKYGKEKTRDRKFKKIKDFLNNCNSFYTLIFVVKEKIIKHKEAWENSIKYDDGYLNRYYKGLLTQSINNCDDVLENLKETGFKLKESVIETIENEIVKEIRAGIIFKNDMNEYSKEIVLSSFILFSFIMNLKRIYSEYSELKKMFYGIQRLINITKKYFDFFERDIHKLKIIE